jgi:hypothetical protein
LDFKALAPRCRRWFEGLQHLNNFGQGPLHECRHCEAGEAGPKRSWTATMQRKHELVVSYPVCRRGNIRTVQYRTVHYCMFSRSS